MRAGTATASAYLSDLALAHAHLGQRRRALLLLEQEPRIEQALPGADPAGILTRALLARAIDLDRQVDGPDLDEHRDLLNTWTTPPAGGS